MAFLKIQDIRKSYYLGNQEFPILKGINLDFELGQFVSILGESGGGKSTLMNIIGGLDRQFEGKVTINGKSLNHRDERQMDDYRRATVGYIYQSYNLINHLTVLENVLISLEMTTLTHAKKIARAKELLEQVGLADQMKKYPNQLSGGQKQRVAVARALAADPQIIIADEPTGALDAQNTQEVLTLLNDIAKSGKLVIAVTHSQEVANYGTRIVHLAEGQIDEDVLLKPAYVKPANQSNPLFTDRPLSALSSYQNAVKHLTHSFWRNSLIVLGTAIGLFAVLLFTGLGAGIKSYINSEVTSLANPNVVTVKAYSKNSQDSSQMSSSSTTTSSSTITQTQVNALKKTSKMASIQPGYQFTNATVQLNQQVASAQSLTTWTANYSKDSLTAGKAPKANEVVIDKKSVAQKFATKNYKSVIGKMVTVTWNVQKSDGTTAQVKQNLKVSGVLQTTSAAGIDVLNYRSTKAALKSAGVAEDVNFIVVKVKETNDVKAVTKQINNIKQDNKRIFTASTIGSMLDMINTIISLATNVLTAIAAISLIVSALMIIVTMFMSVSERTREIGVLRALGESKKDIRRLFTSESILIGLTSATLATGLGLAFGAILNKLLYSIAKFNLVQISLKHVILVFILSLVISYVAALLPSRRAARLNPIDALSTD